MCPTHDPELVSRPEASSPPLISHPAETFMKTLIKQKHKHWNMTVILVEKPPCFQFILQLFVHACSVSFLCVLYIYLSGVSTSQRGVQPFGAHWKAFHSFLPPRCPKISSFRTPARIVRRWCSRSPRCVSTDACQCFSILILFQPVLVVLGNSELKVRHVVFYVLKMRATFPINSDTSCLTGRSYFYLLLSLQLS